MDSNQQTPIDSDVTVSKKRRHTGLWVSGIVAIVILGGLAGTAKAMDVFASAKQLTLDSVANQGTNVPTTAVQEKWNIQLKNIQLPGGSSTEQALLSTLNNAALNFNILLDAKNQTAEVDLNTSYQSVTRHASLWVNKNSAVLSASDYQPLLGGLLPSSVQIPKYLVTDASQASAISKFWSELSSSSKQLSQQNLAAVRQLETLMIGAIPSQYFHRDGLTGVSLSFDQAGFEAIVKAEVQTVYAHKDEFASLLSQLESANLPAGQTKAAFKQSILQTLSNTPEEAVMAAVSTALNSGDVTVKPTTLTVHKPLFGTPTEVIDGGIAVKIPQVNVGGEVDYHVTSSALKSKISVPTPTSSQSESFTAFAQQLSGAGAN